MGCTSLEEVKPTSIQQCFKQAGVRIDVQAIVSLNQDPFNDIDNAMATDSLISSAGNLVWHSRPFTFPKGVGVEEGKGLVSLTSTMYISLQKLGSS